MTIHKALETLINQEETLEDQLDLLTEIGITTSSKDTLGATEDIRYALSLRPKVVARGRKESDELQDTVESTRELSGSWLVGGAEGTGAEEE